VHSEDRSVEALATQSESGEVIADSNAVCKRYEPVFGSFLFSLNYCTIGEGRHHVFDLDVLILLNALVHYKVSVVDIEI